MKKRQREIRSIPPERASRSRRKKLSHDSVAADFLTFIATITIAPCVDEQATRSSPLYGIQTVPRFTFVHRKKEIQAWRKSGGHPFTQMLYGSRRWWALGTHSPTTRRQQHFSSGTPTRLIFSRHCHGGSGSGKRAEERVDCLDKLWKR